MAMGARAKLPNVDRNLLQLRRWVSLNFPQTKTGGKVTQGVSKSEKLGSWVSLRRT